MQPSPHFKWSVWGWRQQMWGPPGFPSSCPLIRVRLALASSGVDLASIQYWFDIDFLINPMSMSNRPLRKRGRGVGSRGSVPNKPLTKSVLNLRQFQGTAPSGQGKRLLDSMVCWRIASKDVCVCDVVVQGFPTRGRKCSEMMTLHDSRTLFGITWCGGQLAAPRSYSFASRKCCAFQRAPKGLPMRTHPKSQASKTLTSLNKEVRRCFPGDTSIWSCTLFLPLAITVFGGPGGYFSLAIIAFRACGFIDKWTRGV